MNQVEEYLSSRKGVMLSATSISKKLKIPRKKVFYLVKTSDKIRRVKPLEVGSNAFYSKTFTMI
jgi:hypothetical protein